MNENGTNKGERRSVIRLLAITTLLFFALLGGLLLLNRQLPIIRENNIVRAIEAGKLDRARRLAQKLDDEEKRNSFLTECDYWEAVALMEEKRWDEAAALLTKAAAFYDAPERKTECDYQIAAALSDEGRWEEAEALFLALGTYRDAPDRVLACRFSQAQSLEANGRKAEAAALYQMLGDYRDARGRLYAMAQEETGILDPETAVAVLLGQTPDAAALLKDLKAKRELLPRGIIDVGFFHTVGLREDGSAVACGDDSFGQCQVPADHDLIAVAAGAYHTLLLHKDGTVSAVGRSSEGQCDTADWSDIVQIAAADYASFGLRSDGTLVWTGYNHYDRCAVWSDLTGVYVGSYNVAALRSDGGHWIYPTPVGDETLPTGLVELALDTGFCFGLTADGNLVGTRETPEGWSDILCLSASATRLLALRSDGIVLSYAFRTQDELDFSALQGVVAIAAGATHSAVVLRDGSVQVLGDCSLGQGDTALWKLAVQPG